ncbi:MAG: hypothetical protein ABI615_01975 [Chthoniobacterales bacterium]
MTSTGRLLILLVVVLCCFFLPGQAVRLAPRVFDQELVLLLFAGVTAFLGSLGLFISLRKIFDAQAARSMVIPFLGFLIFFGLTFSLYAMQLKESYTHRDQITDLLSSKALPLSLHKLVAQSTPDERQAVAMGIFRVYGVPVLYEFQKGQFSFYRPSQDDIKEQKEFRLIAQKSTQILASYDFEIFELERLIFIYAAGLLVVFGAGAVWITMLKVRPLSEDLEPPSL